jgi:spermidine/putrescine ABC transporter ATP-binding subunit
MAGALASAGVDTKYLEPSNATATPDLEVRELTKRFAQFLAVDRVSFSVSPGEFVSILGPSGCGKTTTLRMIAGLEEVSGGRVVIRGRDVTHLPPEKRDTAMVFQSYALFPHMDVFDNVAFGLKMRKVDKSEVEERVQTALDRVRLRGYEKRKPSQLSGGQRQRVAVARAIVVEPAILLLDEALTNLDRRLRQQLQLELKALQEDLKITSLFVTHDQEEALTLSDRIIVMDQARIAQDAPPSTIYDRPASAFVAQFIGESNRFDGEVVECMQGLARVRTSTGREMIGAGKFATGDLCTVVVRPHAISLHSEPAGSENQFEGMVQLWAYKGESYEYLIRLLDGEEVLVNLPRREAVFDKGSRVFLSARPEDVSLVPRG